MHRSVTALIPASARTIEVDLRMIWSESYNDGYADNLSLLLLGHLLYLPLILR